MQELALITCLVITSELGNAVELNLHVKTNEVLSFESVSALVVLSNRTDETVAVPYASVVNGSVGLSFLIDVNGLEVPYCGIDARSGSSTMTLGPRQALRLEMDINNWYNLSNTGTYTIVCKWNDERGKTRRESQKVVLSVVDGDGREEVSEQKKHGLLRYVYVATTYRSQKVGILALLYCSSASSGRQQGIWARRVPFELGWRREGRILDAKNETVLLRFTNGEGVVASRSGGGQWTDLWIRQLGVNARLEYAGENRMWLDVGEIDKTRGGEGHTLEDDSAGQQGANRDGANRDGPRR